MNVTAKNIKSILQTFLLRYPVELELALNFQVASSELMIASITVELVLCSCRWKPGVWEFGPGNRQPMSESKVLKLGVGRGVWLPTSQGLKLWLVILRSNFKMGCSRILLGDLRMPVVMPGRPVSRKRVALHCRSLLLQLQLLLPVRVCAVNPSNPASTHATILGCTVQA